MSNPTLEGIIDFLQANRKEHYVVEHSRPTTTVKEKRKLLLKRSKTDYESYGHVLIVQGSLLSYREVGKENLIVCFHNGEHRIDFDVLKSDLGISKKRDLRFYKGNVSDALGLETGAVSPFMTCPENVAGIYFDKRMIDNARQNPGQNYDMAVSQQKSLFANVADVYDALQSSPTTQEKTKVVKMTYDGLDRRKGNELSFDITDPNLGRNLVRQTGFQFYSSPAWFEWDGHRTQGTSGRHFVTLRGEEPKGVESSGIFELYSMGMGIERNADGQAKYYPDWLLLWNRDYEKFSRTIFPDRRSK